MADPMLTPPLATPPSPGPVTEFKPNIYPIMYWALAFGVAAGVLLLLIQLLSRFITVLWFPVFLAGLLYGGFRNYKRQKAAWVTSTGTVPTAGTAWEEIKEAASDITAASQNLMQEEAQNEAAPETQTEVAPPEQPSEDQPQVPPTQP